MKQPPRAILCCSLLTLVAIGLSGCVPAESAQYQRKMSKSVAPQRSASADVAREFGLERQSPMVSLGTSDH